MDKTISRRGLTRGVAWSVPAVVVAAQAPALAASPTPECVPDGTASFTGLGTVDLPGVTHQSFQFQTNPTDPSVDSSVVNVAVIGSGSTQITGDTITVTFPTDNPGNKSASFQLVDEPTNYVTRVTATLAGVTADQIDTSVGAVILGTNADGTVTVDLSASNGSLFFTEPTLTSVQVTAVTIDTGSATNGQDVAACGGIQFEPLPGGLY